MATAGNITAVLTLDSSKFKSSLTSSTTAVDKFKEGLLSFSKNSTEFEKSIDYINTTLERLKTNLKATLSGNVEGLNNFKEMALAVNRLSKSLVELSSDTMNAERGINILNTVFENWASAMNGVQVEITQIAKTVTQLGNSSEQASSKVNTAFNQMRNTLNQWALEISKTVAQTERMETAIQKNVANFGKLSAEFLALAKNAQAFNNITAISNVALERNDAIVKQVSNDLLRMAENANKFNSSANSINSTLMKTTSTFNSFRTGFSLATNTANTFNASLSKINTTLSVTQTKMSTLQTNTSTNSFIGFDKSLNNTTTSLNNTSTSTVNLGNSLTTLDGKVNTTTGAVEKLDSSNKKLEATQKQVATASQQSGNALRGVGASAQSSSASMNTMSANSNKLSQALYSLMRVGRLVAIMFGYQIAYQFLHATTETVNARSEMENYFRMLNYGSTEIENFNKSLDETVSQFQRVNKYSLGETTLSIGVEFDLTPDQMAKANPVIAMITSEYMRAGRTPAEASLAVKDIMQGEFTRLSRETGVGEEELKQAGWSGDVKDIDSLLDALKKIGHSRHWDDFAEKAHSLNDAITILQNRFGEWSAEMVNLVQPAIVNAFNEIMQVAGALSDIFGGVFTWLTGDGLGQAIVKWTGLGVAIVSVVGSLISFRTGANLVQVAQMGLTNTIGATVLGLEAEVVAENGLKNAIFGRLTGVKAETVAEIGVRDAILSKILGLDAEIVKEEGLKEAITTSAFARELERMQLRGATEEEIANTLAMYENELAHRRTITVLTAHAMGLKMTTVAEHGFLVALLESKTGMEASRIASMGLIKQILLLGASFVAPLAIVGAFAIAVGGLAVQMYNSAKAMEKFNKLVKEGDKVIKDAKKDVDRYTKRHQILEQQLANTTEGSKDYYQIQDKLRTNTDNLTTANYNYENSIKAVERANSAREKYEEAKGEIAIDTQTKLADAYMKYGYSAVEAHEMANSAMGDANRGAEQYRHTLQGLASINTKYVQTVEQILATHESDRLASPFGKKDNTKEYLDSAQYWHDMIESGYEKGMTDESFMGRLDGWLSYYTGQIGNWWNNLASTIDSGNIIGAIQGALWGVVHGLGKLPIFKDFWGWVFKNSGLTKYKGMGWEGLKAIIMDSFSFGDDAPAQNTFIKGIIDNIIGWFKDDEWERSILDGVGKSISDMGHNLSNWIVNSLQYMWDNLSQNWNNFWAEHPIISEEGIANFFGDIDTLTQTLGEWWNNLVSSLSGDALGSIGDFIGAFFNLESMGAKLMEFASQVPTLINTYVVQPIWSAVRTGILNIPILGDILTMLESITSAEPNAFGKGTSLANQIKTAIENVIRNIPILGDILVALGVIPQANPTANAHGKGVGDSVKSGVGTGVAGTATKIFNEINGGLDKIAGLVGKAFSVAQGVGQQIWNGINSVLQIHSPGFIHDQILNEFGTYIPSAITDSGNQAYTTAQAYGQQVVDGVGSMYENMPQVAMDFFSQGALTEYQADANTVTTLSDDLSLTTTDAFASMQSGVNSSVTGMASDVTTQYNTMQQNQNTMLTNMQNSNLNGYKQMQLQTNQQLLTMRDQTSNVTHQMINAWDHMRVQLVNTANHLRSESSAHFNQLSSTIGSFYRKIQNPANWGAGYGSGNVRTPRNPTVGRAFAKGIKTRSGSIKHGAGGDYYTGRPTMTLRTLKNLMCPNGDCGNLFDGLDLNKVVDVNQFLATVDMGHGFGSWSSWSPTHYNYIRNKSDQWQMKSPQLLGRINTNADFKVGDFENGTPKISFGAFQSMAESLFSEIPYRFYYDSSWKGSWLGAIQAGACNCYDGASALIAFAQTCGFDGYMAHGSWKGIPHVWAVINGKKMDTTAWQNGYGWNGPSAGSPTPRRATPSAPNNVGSSRTVNVNIDMKNANIYGIDDLETVVGDATRKAMREEFNDSYTVGY